MTVDTEQAPTLDRATYRSSALDALRGLAVALMILDHLLVVTGHPDAGVRHNLTRIAMPLFAVLAGHLFRRLNWRWALIAVTGLVLPAVVPWIDSPNILLLFAMGAVLLWIANQLRPRLRPGALAVLVALPLVWRANGYPTGAAGFYDPASVFALMALGAMLARHHITNLFPDGPNRAVTALGYLGRYPLIVYVGHLLALQLWLQYA